MKDSQTQVTEFMVCAGQECPQKPTIPSPEVMTLRYNLIQEELDELITDGFGDPDNIFIEPHEPNLEKIADAIGDLLVVVLGTAVACGINIEPIFNEIMRSNMTKFIEGYRREDGKWMKGKSFTPPNLQPILDAQTKG